MGQARLGGAGLRLGLLALAGLVVAACPAAVVAQGFDAWVRPKVPVQALGASGVRGQAAFLPTADGDYRLRASVALPQGGPAVVGGGKRSVRHSG